MFIWTDEKVKTEHVCCHVSSLTCRVSSVLDRAASSLVPFRGSAPIFCPWAYSSVTSVFVGGVTSGRGNGCTVGGATEGRPGTGFKGFKKKFEPWFMPCDITVILCVVLAQFRWLTCRFHDVMWSSTRNLPPVLVHAPAVCGLSITLDWTERRFTSNRWIKNYFT